MILSSIVQRESPVNDEDRQLVCGVLINRLNKQMPLQCDVTVNYGNQEVKIDVKHTDLNKDTKYNTYKYNGLPVGPISSISTKYFILIPLITIYIYLMFLICFRI